ncbi:SOS response-associated peptidase family protein [Psychrobacillus sp. FSL K6-2365]|uniref:SOS response-associated peptidase family protein n=1 Tax=Psychrobacillus sp. FSL K6-2365 TaxID=2921546 RepID=UPI0030FC9BF4
MSGRYTLFTDFESLIDRFDIEYSMEEDLFMPSYNIAPSQKVVSIINDGKKNRLGKLRWGLI